MTDTMRCVECGRLKAWPDGFPTTVYAICWKCQFDQHVALNHPPKRKWHFRSPFYREPKPEQPPTTDELAAALGTAVWWLVHPDGGPTRLKRDHIEAAREVYGRAGGHISSDDTTYPGVAS